ncbi:hypothetical protein DXV76_21000 [Rhodobacteraceae bacterium CCMM004]|nr:hypothetical protein DXV76_21000 [Rhodobacteraceae bacterium CCMM004]
MLCFLPNADAETPAPAYAWESWKPRLQGVDLLYLADPYLILDGDVPITGSWFVNPETGASILPDIAQAVNILARRKGYGRVVFYGSGMGGYAALVLGSFIRHGHVIAERPQIHLDADPRARAILAAHGYPTNVPTITELAKNGFGRAARVTLIASMYDADHLDNHTAPLIEELRTSERRATGATFEIVYYDIPSTDEDDATLAINRARPHLAAAGLLDLRPAPTADGAEEKVLVDAP